MDGLICQKFSEKPKVNCIRFLDAYLRNLHISLGSDWEIAPRSCFTKIKESLWYKKLLLYTSHY
uniref:Uncharacterized protein n=1 Tax=Solanum lycopersicum TaxID=4081 RepID=A0A3Q7FR56_SOLLC